MSEEDVLRERYGAPRARRPRWTRYVAAAAAVVLGVLIAVLAYRNLGSEPITAERRAFTPVSDSQVRITFTVTRDSADRPVDCIVRSRDAGGGESGRREVYVPAGGESRTVRALLRTADRAVTGEVYGCSYRIPAYLSP